MLSSSIFGLLLLVSAAVAAPTKSRGSVLLLHNVVQEDQSPAPLPIKIRDLNGQKLAADDIILYGGDRAEIWKREHFEAAHAHLLDHPGHGLNSSVGQVNRRNEDASLEKRNCLGIQLLYSHPTKTFLDWDKPISPVSRNIYATLLIQITKGYTLSQSVTVTAGVDWKPIKDVLSITGSIAYDRTWSTTDTVAMTYPVPQSQYGVVVSNALATRHSGKVKRGCVGDVLEEYEYYSDKYTDRSMNGMNWVDGVIQLCANPNHPIPGCIGGQPIR